MSNLNYRVMAALRIKHPDVCWGSTASELEEERLVTEDVPTTALEHAVVETVSLLAEGWLPTALRALQLRDRYSGQILRNGSSIPSLLFPLDLTRAQEVKLVGLWALARDLTHDVGPVEPEGLLAHRLDIRTTLMALGHVGVWRDVLCVDARIVASSPPKVALSGGIEVHEFWLPLNKVRVYAWVDGKTVYWARGLSDPIEAVDPAYGIQLRKAVRLKAE